MRFVLFSAVVVNSLDLFATAIGLVAAIPAVMAYNYFTRRIRVLRSEMDTFEQDYLNIIKRHFLR